jgi:hypothetical protein
MPPDPYESRGTSFHDEPELNCPMLNAAIISCGDDVGPQSDITMLNRFAYMMTDHV